MATKTAAKNLPADVAQKADKAHGSVHDTKSSNGAESNETLQEVRREAVRLGKRWRKQLLPLAAIGATHGVGVAASSLAGPAALLPLAAGWSGAVGGYSYAHNHCGRGGKAYAGIAALGSAMFQVGIAYSGGESLTAAFLWAVGALVSMPWWVKHSEPDPDVTAENDALRSPPGELPAPPATPPSDGQVVAEKDWRATLWDEHMGAGNKPLPGSELECISDFPYGWTATIAQPIGGHWEAAFNQRKQILSVYDLPDKRVFVESINGVTVRKSRLTVLTCDPLQETTRWLGPGLDPTTGRFPLMVTADGETLYFKLWNPGAGAVHSLVSGVTRSGKTKVLDLILTECSMSDRIMPLVIDGGGGASLPQWIGRVKLFAKTPDETRKVLRYALAVMDSRRPVLEAQGGGSIEPSPDIPLVPVIIDEAHKRLMSDDDVDNRDIVRMCERIGQEGAKFGVGLILATQAPSAKQLGNSTVLRDQVKTGTIVGLRTLEKGNEGMISTGDPMPENLRDLPSEFPNGEPTHGLGYMMTSRKIRARALLLENPKDWPVTDVDLEWTAARIPVPRMGEAIPVEASGSSETVEGSAADDAIAHALADGCPKTVGSLMQATGLTMLEVKRALKTF